MGVGVKQIVGGADKEIRRVFAFVPGVFALFEASTVFVASQRPVQHAQQSPSTPPF